MMECFGFNYLVSALIDRGNKERLRTIIEIFYIITLIKLYMNICSYSIIKIVVVRLFYLITMNENEVNS